MWWSWKNWFWTVSTLGRCGGLERTDFEQFLLWERYYGLERTDFEQVSTLGKVWWSWKNWIWTVSTFGKVWWSWTNRIWTVSTFGRCGGLERTDFEQFLLNLGRCGGLERTWFWTVSTLGTVYVVLKELILNSFYFGTVWLSWKKCFWTVSTSGQCGGLERSAFEQFLLWEGMMVLKELNLNSFYFGKV